MIPGQVHASGPPGGPMEDPDVMQQTEQEILFQKQMQQDEEIELKKKIALYYHPLFQQCLSQWFLILQQENYNRLSREQYMEINVRIQKSLILDFDYESAKQSAREDWKIDVERESIEKKDQGLSTMQSRKDKVKDGQSSPGLNEDGDQDQVEEQEEENVDDVDDSKD